MSLVGPRPLPQRDFDQLEDWHKKRYLVLPGMTGLWQVSGPRRARLRRPRAARLPLPGALVDRARPDDPAQDHPGGARAAGRVLSEVAPDRTCSTGRPACSRTSAPCWASRARPGAGKSTVSEWIVARRERARWRGGRRLRADGRVPPLQPRPERLGLRPGRARRRRSTPPASPRCSAACARAAGRSTRRASTARSRSRSRPRSPSAPRSGSSWWRATTSCSTAPSGPRVRACLHEVWYLDAPHDVLARAAARPPAAGRARPRRRAGLARRQRPAERAARRAARASAPTSRLQVAPLR